MSSNPLHKGIIVGIESSAIANVWIPSMFGSVHQGSYEYLYKNTGSNLDGKALDDAINSSIRCRIMTPLASGAWWTAIPEFGASVPGNPNKINSNEVLDYTLATRATSHKTTPQISIMSKSNTPSATLSVVNPILGEVGGVTIPSANNVPPGTFPRLHIGQHVLIAYINSSSMPIILGTLPTDKEWEATLG